MSLILTLENGGLFVGDAANQDGSPGIDGRLRL